jgi:hypothetical protein
MTSPRKATANRANAVRSTGPKSTEGRRKSSRNALRHRLAIPIECIPELAAQAESVAQVVLHQMGGVDCLHLSQRVLEAALDILRVRAARAMMINSISVAHSATMLPPEPLDDERVDDLVANEGSPTLVYAEYRLPCPGAAEKVARAAAQVLPQLARLDRYERRAISRRRRAIWALLAEIDRGQSTN